MDASKPHRKRNLEGHGSGGGGGYKEGRGQHDNAFRFPELEEKQRLEEAEGDRYSYMQSAMDTEQRLDKEKVKSHGGWSGDAKGQKAIDLAVLSSEGEGFLSAACCTSTLHNLFCPIAVLATTILGILLLEMLSSGLRELLAPPLVQWIAGGLNGVIPECAVLECCIWDCNNEVFLCCNRLVPFASASTKGADLRVADENAFWLQWSCDKVRGNVDCGGLRWTLC